MNILYEFASPIGYIEIDPNLCYPYVDLIIGEIEKNISNCAPGAKYTNDNLNSLDEFQNLTQLIDSHATKFLENIVGIDKNDCKMTGMWANMYEGTGDHEIHQHPNSFISGVFYVQIPECNNKGNLLIVDPRSAKNMMYANFKKHTSLSDRMIEIEPKTGLLLLFPSWLEHGVSKFIGNFDQKRIGISFNYQLIKCSRPTMKIK
jgi:uncharacterized protein (TIGR02466 family)